MFSKLWRDRASIIGISLKMVESCLLYDFRLDKCTYKASIKYFELKIQ